MDILLQEIQTVVVDSLLLALLVAMASTAVSAALMRALFALGGVQRRSLAWTRFARGFHAVFWVLMPSVTLASLALLYGVENHSLQAVERHQPAMERWLGQQWQAHSGEFEETGQQLRQHGDQWRTSIESMSGWSGWALQQGLERIDVWLQASMANIDVTSPGWSEQAMRLLVEQWRLTFWALYFGLLSGLSPLLLLPFSEWLFSRFANVNPPQEPI